MFILHEKSITIFLLILSRRIGHFRNLLGPPREQILQTLFGSLETQAAWLNDDSVLPSPNKTSNSFNKEALAPPLSSTLHSFEFSVTKVKFEVSLCTFLNLIWKEFESTDPKGSQISENNVLPCAAAHEFAVFHFQSGRNVLLKFIDKKNKLLIAKGALWLCIFQKVFRE